MMRSRALRWMILPLLLGGLALRALGLFLLV